MIDPSWSARASTTWSPRSSEAARGRFAQSSSVAAQAARECDTDPAIAELVESLHAFDALFG